MCLNKRSCGIAFLPAITSILWESEAQKDREEFLRELDLKAEADHIPVHYSWVNTTCHPEWFKYFDVQSFSAPTVVYYNPQHHKHEFTIGKFTKKSLAESELQFVRGKLSLRDTPTKQEDIQLRQKDCQAGLFDDGNASDEGFDDILAEILAEEEERKKE